MIADSVDREREAVGGAPERGFHGEARVGRQFSEFREDRVKCSLAPLGGEGVD